MLSDLPLDSIINLDCLSGLKKLPDGCIDLVVMDPPYLMSKTGGGIFGNANRSYLSELHTIVDGINNGILDELMRVMKRPNIYIWANKTQHHQYLSYFAGEHGCNYDLLTWHKTNPIPMCGNRYLPDTEYLLFFRAEGVPLYGKYETKSKYYITKTNKEDKEKFGHPAIKPLHITRNIIINSSKEGDIVLDPYIGSGTTAVAAVQTNRHYIGYEIEPNYAMMAKERIAAERPMLSAHRQSQILGQWEV